MVNKKLVAISIFAGIFISLAIFSFISFESVCIKFIYNFMQMKNNSIAFKYYKDFPVDLRCNVYFFNVTNANEIVEFGSKPRLQEIGPFVYKLYFNKTDVKFNGNDTLTFYEKRTWYFDASKSAFNDDLQITTINGPLVTALTLIQTVPNPLRYLLTRLIESIESNLFIKRTVRELMFDGYADPFAALGPLLDPSLINNHGKFGYMYPNKNASTDSLFTVFAGANISKFTLIDKLDRKAKLDLWLTDECNQINDATNGESRPSLLQHPMQQIKIYQPLICRAILMNFTSETITKDGIAAQRFVMDKNMLRNASDYPPNSCYESKIPKKSKATEKEAEVEINGNNILESLINAFTSNVNEKGKRETMQFPSGVMDFSKCYFGAPALVSLPHFLHADPYYSRTIDGLKPNEDKHEFWIDVEPITGISVDAALRFQINFHINKPSGIHKFKKVPEIVFPVFWQEIVIIWPESFASLIRTLFKALHLSPTILFSIFISIAIILLLTFVYKIVKVKRSYIHFATMTKTVSND
ncbi:scavenger receptor class B member 1-like protein [Leptotrombidium deliense]|uniref:Scavenger receptor class B member 1 n=1 Tax=Leptotrombidium deliense TaxID=299467 RepID=A0A443SME9_9ACAR|nr:scavenger receptor class B member 1-like protein [Leptotrombidium deliense]